MSLQPKQGNWVNLSLMLAAFGVTIALVESVYYLRDIRSPYFRPSTRRWKLESANHSGVSASPTTGNDTPGLDNSQKYARGRFWYQQKVWTLLPNTQTRSIVKDSAGKAVYDVEIRVDSHGRRESLNPSPERRTNYWAVFGCSFAFGEGVSDAQTLPSQLALNATVHKAYNYGVPGVGPFQILERMRATAFRSEIAEKEGVGIYVFMDEHLRRMTPGISYTETYVFGSRGVYYEEDEDGQLIRYDTYRDAHPILTQLFRLASLSQTFRHHRIDFPIRYGAHELKAFTRVVREMARTYENKFGNDQFYVLLYPGARQPGLVARYLEEARIKHLDYGAKSYSQLHPGDAHPDAEAHATIARQIARDLGLDRRLK